MRDPRSATTRRRRSPARARSLAARSTPPSSARATSARSRSASGAPRNPVAACHTCTAPPPVVWMVAARTSSRCTASTPATGASASDRPGTTTVTRHEPSGSPGQVHAQGECGGLARVPSATGSSAGGLRNRCPPSTEPDPFDQLGDQPRPHRRPRDGPGGGGVGLGQRGKQVEYLDRAHRPSHRVDRGRIVEVTTSRHGREQQMMAHQQPQALAHRPETGRAARPAR